tara:strand:+ start:354 stop:1325 length:972 start_codon:yes stop_codon:yes gene_type:complete
MKKYLLLFLPLLMFSQVKIKQQLAHTYSIVAMDEKTGEMAIGVQSHWFSVGTIVSWGKSGVGVVATQSFVNPAYGPKGIKLMESGVSAEKALTQLVSEDESRDYRQVAMLDVNGSVNAFTGEKCIISAGQYIGKNFSVQANMMLNDKVVPAMKKAFEENPNLQLAERVIKVFEAAEESGGDIRGKQSAAVLVVGPEKTKNEWEDKKIDLRVDDSENPIKEIKRLLKVNRAYEHMNKGDLAIENGDMEQALVEYASAETLFPDNLEMKFWKAVALLNNSRFKQAKEIFKYVIDKDGNWEKLLLRLPASDLVSLSPNQIKNQILY